MASRLSDTVHNFKERKAALDDDSLLRPNAFAPREGKLAANPSADNLAREQEERTESARQAKRAQDADAFTNKYRPAANRFIAALILISLGLTVAQIVLQALGSGQSILTMIRGTTNAPAIYAIVYFVLVTLVGLGLIRLVYLDRHERIHSARMLTRALMVLLIFSLLVHVILNGMSWGCVFYLFQFSCVIAYQIYNDPNLMESMRHPDPREEAVAIHSKTYELDPERRGYISLNFFNLFWIFMAASVIGLVFEMVFCLVVNGVWKDRSGILWGPFSPIYGVGAVLMTVALNRWWYCNSSLIFLVSAFIGAGFEFFVSWYMETAFGVTAWDYSDNFLSLDGRTDFGHWVVWGFVGVIWIRQMLPTLMRLVDRIPLKWRATITVIAVVFMLVNAVMTLLALDCWSLRQAGYPVDTELQQFFETRYGDDFMAERFASMDISQESALRAQEAAS